MQYQSAEKCSHGARLERLRIHLQASWAEMAQRLGLSESMLFQVKKGTKSLSPKAEHRLSLAEQEAGFYVGGESSVVQETAHREDDLTERLKRASIREIAEMLSPQGRRLLGIRMLGGIESDMRAFFLASEGLADLVQLYLKEPTTQRRREVALFAADVKHKTKFAEGVWNSVAEMLGDELRARKAEDAPHDVEKSET